MSSLNLCLPLRAAVESIWKHPHGQSQALRTHLNVAKTVSRIVSQVNVVIYAIQENGQPCDISSSFEGRRDVVSRDMPAI